MRALVLTRERESATSTMHPMSSRTTTTSSKETKRAGANLTFVMVFTPLGSLETANSSAFKLLGTRVPLGFGQPSCPHMPLKLGWVRGLQYDADEENTSLYVPRWRVKMPCALLPNEHQTSAEPKASKDN